MGLTQGAINKIKSFVQSAKRLLMKEFADQIQQYYGISLDGGYLMVEELTTKDGSVIQTARLLRERLDYLEDTIAGSNKKEEAVEQLVREQAFTILNRFAALRMAEERQIIPETIKQGYNSEGFQVFDQLSGGAQTAQQFERYNWFLKAMFDELAIDLPAVFDRFSPYALLFPSEKVMLELLDIINDEYLSIYREEGQQPMNLWEEDETIGWVYQYYNSREEISAMRDASGAPRNSRELAVRNQFFTPRYVVQFLVDNSLGRQWFEMTKGQTSLINDCQYMVKRKQEIFLDKGETIPETKIDGANYIEYRALKDPREILMLDPACGSMHFGLYCFDLFEKIYIEAWDNHPELMRDLRDEYLREEFIKRIPGYILQYNIHGVDIDPRAIQIAGLSLWLRAQKSYKKLGIQPADRPMIKKSNLVVAEPMPGDAEMLSEFTNSLPGPIGKLVRVIWDKMQLAGETGLLLKIEEELKKEIEIAKKEYKAFKNTSAQSTLFADPEESKAAEMAAIYGKGQKITKDFFDTAEEEVLKALQSFSENAEGEHAFQKLLFAEDTARGFAFIELCRKSYDVIVMNPPFGAGSIAAEKYYKNSYPSWGKNILSCFFLRGKNQLSRQGKIGAIFDRTVIIKSSYEPFRIESFIGNISIMLDTGWGVLDANVETACLLLDSTKQSQGFFLDLRAKENKDNEVMKAINSNLFLNLDSSKFTKLPNSIIGYYFSSRVLDIFNDLTNMKTNGLQVREGHSFISDRHFRLHFELVDSSNYFPLYNGGTFSMFYTTPRLMVKYGLDGEIVNNHKSVILRNKNYQKLPGIGYGKRGDILDAHVINENMIFGVEGKSITDISRQNSLRGLAYLNSSIGQCLLNLYSGQHKQAGYVNKLPIPEAIGFDEELIIQLIRLKIKWASLDITSMHYSSWFLGLLKDDLNSYMIELKELYSIDTSIYSDLVNKNDEFWLRNIIPDKDLKERANSTKENRPEEYLLGFSKSPSSLDIEFHQEIVQCILHHYYTEKSIKQKIEENIDSNNLFLGINKINFELGKDRQFLKVIDSAQLAKNLIVEMNANFNESITNDIVIGLPQNSIEFYLSHPYGFFDYHLGRFTHNRREAPIYWPIATKSNSYVIWLYYPALSENTLFSIVNDLLEPKLDDIKELVVALEKSSDLNDLNEQRTLRDELIDFKEELLRVAQLPYKPNHDDGVLITAAPLHNLFNHNKWRKKTEACWKKLEKGEYDWAHLAYSIWPNRVTNKCKKDLSMAIAHGLESICEIKPKKKKTKKKRGVEIDNQDRLL